MVKLNLTNTRKMKKLILLLSAFMLIASSMTAQKSAKDLGLAAITQGTIEGQLEFLASDWTLGRETGTDGAYMAADYVASMFKVWGLEPGGDKEQTRMSRNFRRTPGQARPEPKSTYFQNFQLVKSTPGDSQELSIVSKADGGFQSVDFVYLTDFSLSGGETGMSGEVPVVFVGYGLKDDEKGYDDFKDVDLKGKIVIKLSGFPGHNAPESKTYEKFKPEDTDRNNMQENRMSRRGRGSRFPWATERGALGVIEVNPRNNPIAQWAQNLPQQTEIAGPARSSVRESYGVMNDELRAAFVNFSVTQRFVNELVKGLGYSFEDLEATIAKTGKPASKVLKGKYVKFKTTINSEILQARNVVGVLEGKDTENIIVIGGHYDHLGVRDGWIYNGADDNASGTVGVMTIAKAMAATGEKPEKTIVFCAWTGEEKGLIGSSVFANNPYDWNILCNLNYDMISRNSPGEDQDKKISMTFTSTMPILKELTEKHNSDYHLDMEVDYKGSEKPGGGSDHAPFADKGIPVFYFMAGFPPEYHQPQDHTSLVEWDKMLNIVKLGYLNVYELANMKWE